MTLDRGGWSCLLLASFRSSRTGTDTGAPVPVVVVGGVGALSPLSALALHCRLLTCNGTTACLVYRHLGSGTMRKPI